MRWHQRLDGADYTARPQGPMLHNMASRLVAELEWLFMWSVAINNRMLEGSGGGLMLTTVFSSNGWSIMCHNFEPSSKVVNVALSAPKGSKMQVNRESSQYIISLHMCKHKPSHSWWDSCPLSWCFTPHSLGGLFVSCSCAWQLWHRFLPSWPCSLKCNKSWIPRQCCTSIRVLLVADKWSSTPRERAKTSRQQKMLSSPAQQK